MICPKRRCFAMVSHTPSKSPQIESSTWLHQLALLDRWVVDEEPLLGSKEVWNDMELSKIDHIASLCHRTAKYSRRETAATITRRQTHCGDVTGELRGRMVKRLLWLSRMCNYDENSDDNSAVEIYLPHEPTTVPTAVSILDYHLASNSQPHVNAQNWEIICGGIMSVALSLGDIVTDYPERYLGALIVNKYGKKARITAKKIRKAHWKIASAHEWNIMQPTPFEFAFEMLAIIFGGYPKPTSFSMRTLSAVMNRGMLHPEWMIHSAQPISLAFAAIEVVCAIVLSAGERLRRSPDASRELVNAWASSRYQLYELHLFAQKVGIFRCDTQVLLQKYGLTIDPPPSHVMVKFLALDS